ncbi:hypothetical protein GIB67_023631, partial [Kingdonia uniflora]
MHELALGHTMWHANGSDLNQTHGVFRQCTCPVMCQSTTENHLFVDPFWEGFFSKVRDAGFYVFFNIRRYSTLEFKDLEYNRRTSRFSEEFHRINFVHVLRVKT